MTDAEQIAAYLSLLEHERRLSAHTLRSYTHELEELKRLAANRPLVSLSASDIRGAVVRAHGAGLSARALAHRLSAWRAFYRWFATRVALPSNPVGAVRAPKQLKPLPKALAVDDAHTLMEAPVMPGAVGLRDHAILELFYSSGLRLAELTALDVQYADHDGYRSSSWLNLEAAEVKVLGKGRRERIVPVGAKALDALRAWLVARPQLLRDDPDPLFLSTRGKRMPMNSVRDRVKLAALVAGIPANVHPHVLRHSFATHMLQSSGDLRAVQELLGHSSIASTQVYTALDFQHLARVYDAAHPRAKKRD
ncbi:tyrosine recombinase XerC [Paraburkholderia hayleyella]|uniref:tyrosine recombinase XerC n=1 Tax=Paraburkholderia hayleyella TaxID=2152889 RepID=UPI001292343A|nr:tyrosine recombinase XerC [Paraburkholderia hayleyella]